MASDGLLIQCHYTDFDVFKEIIYDDSYSVVARAKKYFDDKNIVLTCADVPENAVIREYAKNNNVSFFSGELMNVAARFNDCMAEYNIGFAARILLNCFYADFDFIKSRLNLLRENNTDYALLPYNFEIKFGSDVFSKSFLEKFIALGKMENWDRFKFCPWALAETHPEYFNLTYCEKLPVHGMEELQAIRRATKAIYPERHPLADTPLQAYEKSSESIDKEAQDVLDIACGWGDGAKYLARTYPNVTGVDYSKEQIETNVSLNKHDNVSFLAGDGMNENLFDENSFDAIVSMHTMEHIPDDNIFLRNINRWLRSKGNFILEVPVLMEYPFKGIDLPLGDMHIREYRFDELVKQCSLLFDVEEICGVNRGLYIEPEKARNAIWLKLRSRK